MKRVLVVFWFGLLWMTAWANTAIAVGPYAFATPRVAPPMKFGPEQKLDKWGVAFRAPLGATIADIMNDETRQSIEITDVGQNYMLFVGASSKLEEETLDEMDALEVGLMLAPAHLERVGKLTKIKFAGYRALKFEWRDWVSTLKPFPEAKTAGALILIEVKPKQFYTLICMGKDDDTATGWKKYASGVCAQFLRRVRVFASVS